MTRTSFVWAIPPVIILSAWGWLLLTPAEYRAQAILLTPYSDPVPLPDLEALSERIEASRQRVASGGSTSQDESNAEPQEEETQQQSFESAAATLQAFKALLLSPPPLPVSILGGLLESRAVMSKAAARLNVSVEEFDANLYVLPSPRDNRVIITYSDPSPEKCRNAINFLLQELDVYYSRNQLTLTDIQLEAIDSAILVKEREVESKITEVIDRMSKGQTNDLTRIEQIYRDVKFQLEQARVAREAGKERLKQMVEGSSSLPSPFPELDSLRVKLQEERARLSVARKSLGPANPQLRRLELSVSQLENTLEETKQAYIDSVEKDALEVLSQYRTSIEVLEHQAEKTGMLRGQAQRDYVEASRAQRELVVLSGSLTSLEFQKAILSVQSSGTQLQYSVLSPSTTEVKPWNRIPQPIMTGAILFAATIICSLMISPVVRNGGPD